MALLHVGPDDPSPDAVHRLAHVLDRFTQLTHVRYAIFTLSESEQQWLWRHGL